MQHQKQHLQTAMKKVQILKDRVTTLLKLRKADEAVERTKKLFHMSCSFVSNPHLTIFLYRPSCCSSTKTTNSFTSNSKPLCGHGKD